MSAENKQQISSAIKMNIKSKQLFFLKKDYSTQFADWLTNRKEVIVSNVCPISTSSFYCSPALLHWDTIKTTNTLIFGGKEWYFNLEEENIKRELSPSLWNPSYHWILESTPWIPDSRFFVSGTWILDPNVSGIPDSLPCIRIPKPRSLDSTCKIFQILESGFQHLGRNLSYSSAIIRPTEKDGGCTFYHNSFRT